MTQQHHLQLQQTRAGLLSLQAQHNVMRRFAGGNRQVARRYLGSDFVPFPQTKPNHTQILRTACQWPMPL
ncbi:hypothetical protein ACFSZS_31680 [Seohaeicola zhoushanensis]